MSLIFEQVTTGSNVAVKLSNNSFDDSTYFVRVPRDKVTLDNIVSEITSGYPSIDPYVIVHSANLLREQILKFLTQGKAVDILELGTMYLSPEGTVTRDNPQVSDLPTINLKFTPSSSAKEAISGITANSFMISDSSPQISVVTDLYRMQADGCVTPGQMVRITGGNLKVDAESVASNGIWFAPALSTGEPDPDTSTWLAVELSFLARNTNKTLEFHCPSGLTSGSSYFIVITSTYLAGGRTRKTPVTGYSPEELLAL